MTFIIDGVEMGPYIALDDDYKTRILNIDNSNLVNNEAISENGKAYGGFLGITHVETRNEINP